MVQYSLPDCGKQEGKRGGSGGVAHSTGADSNPLTVSFTAMKKYLVTHRWTHRHACLKLSERNQIGLDFNPSR